jgi:hypothetical protein
MIDLPLYTNKEWLEHQYNDLKKTMQQIADEQNIPVNKLRNAMIEFEIPRRKYIGVNHPLWKGGRSKEKTYNMINTPNGYKTVSKYKMEKKLGRPLNLDEVVHHIDHYKRNDNLHNLYLCKNRSQHASIHRQFNRISREIAIGLLKIGKIKFSRILGRYYIPEDAFGDEFRAYLQEEASKKTRQMDIMRL